MINESGPKKVGALLQTESTTVRKTKSFGDFFRGHTALYYFVYDCIKENSYLDIESIIYMFCLQFGFLPSINDLLKKFVSGYNCNPVRIESNMSDVQLWILRTI